MQRIVTLIFLTLLVLPSAYAQDLRVAVGASAAQVKIVGNAGAVEYRNSGLSGMSVDLFGEVCRRISARCTFDYLPFAAMLPAMEAKQYEVALGSFVRTAEREKIVDFSDPIATSSSRLIGKAKRGAEFVKQADLPLTLTNLRNARVIAIAGSSQKKYLDKLALAQGLSIVESTSVQEIMAKLKDGEVDFWLGPVFLSYAAIGNEPPGSFQFYGPPAVEQGLGGTVHIALTKGDFALLERVNTALAEIRSDGTYHRIVRKYFPVSLD